MCADHMYPPLPREPLGASQLLGLQVLWRDTAGSTLVECRGRWILIGKVENKLVALFFCACCYARTQRLQNAASRPCGLSLAGGGEPNCWDLFDLNKNVLSKAATKT